MKYDATMKCLSPKLPGDLATLIFNKRLDLKQISESLPTTEHRPDFLAKVSDEEGDFVIHIEFQTANDRKMTVRMISYYGLILAEHKLPIYPIVLYLSPKGVPVKGEYTSSIRDKHVMTFDYDVKQVGELKSKKIFEKNLYGLYPLTFLMADADLEECARNLDYAITHNYLDSECYVCARILAELKYSSERVKEMIGDDFIKQSSVYKEALHEGEAIGMKEGVSIGREEGEAMGISIGREEGVSIGISMGREKDILSVLATRFNQVPDRLSQRIRNLRERNGSLFDDLIKLAVTAKDISEFEGKLGKMV